MSVPRFSALLGLGIRIPSPFIRFAPFSDMLRPSYSSNFSITLVSKNRTSIPSNKIHSMTKNHGMDARSLWIQDTHLEKQEDAAFCEISQPGGRYRLVFEGWRLKLSDRELCRRGIEGPTGKSMAHFKEFCGKRSEPKKQALSALLQRRFHAMPDILIGDSVDGRGGDSDGTGGEMAPRYLYYRLYTKDGAIQSFNPIYSNDPSISRILPKSITPPHTALSLKKHLCKIEGVAGSNALLFEALSSDAAIPDSTRLKLRGHLGLGVSSREPMALVVGVVEVENRSSGPDQAQEVVSENPDQHETHYIYYRVYDEEGEVNSRTAFDGNDASLGRVDTLSVAPPYTVASLKSCIAKAEHIVDREIQLFEDTDGEALMKDADRASFRAETFPGCLEDDPLALIYGPKKLVQGPTMTRPIQANTYCSG
ncbi:uncharacterized protein LACBIDRAFT_329007 [Laccaria bicolor S238N-H82]|uniref:Predicted protein n=1 Tax=Laccaria bicolor (strain S238N-H82 / ATCC MYA-4686) TaxID=486041 RepID=B0DGR5_LACBS|nr:uncharacterized protein LACBIDRAFT_329007 [Laccaria bicolor S238N-H82]EDR06317.1 predicted protein [Laccaria bicolor S238N-H82]|eukprot:XP_001883178.1 predicted protein [Laccaria bicolor S238N-H82]